MKFSIPEGMLMGVATAATQIEGGNVDSNWNDWYYDLDFLSPFL